MPQQDFIKTNFNLPTYENELSKAEYTIEKINKKITKATAEQNLPGELHTLLFDEIVRVLLYVGHLSEAGFAVEEQLEQMYALKYIHSPALAKQLWLEHYESIHHPYNLLKNRCFRMIDELDELYVALYDSTPPNWNL